MSSLVVGCSTLSPFDTIAEILLCFQLKNIWRETILLLDVMRAQGSKRECEKRLQVYINLFFINRRLGQAVSLINRRKQIWTRQTLISQLPELRI